MGFWDYVFDSEMQQRNDINRQKDIVNASNSKISRLFERVQRLEAELSETRKQHKVLIDVLIEKNLILEADLLRQAKNGSTPSEGSQSSDWIKKRLNDQK